MQTIAAGKLRRYHGKGVLFHLQPSIMFPNIRDLFLVAAGFVQSAWKLLRWRPDVIFMKGGYVCLPVGYAARLLRIPLVLHDSDAHPGLTNRLLAPYAAHIGTGAPLDNYPYPTARASYVGIPVADEFQPYSAEQRHHFKAELGFQSNKPLIVVTGGGLGALAINQAVMQVRAQLLAEASVLLITGKQHYEAMAQQSTIHPDWQLKAFVDHDMHKVLAAADIVVARAGATTLLELAALHKPTVIIPNAMLTGGHQIKNAQVYQKALAALIITEEQLQQNPEVLAHKLIGLLRSPKILAGLGKNIGQFARPHAARDMAAIILTVIRRQGRRR